jgi:hypothetical protein
LSSLGDRSQDFSFSVGKGLEGVVGEAVLRWYHLFAGVDVDRLEHCLLPGALEQPQRREPGLFPLFII